MKPNVPDPGPRRQASSGAAFLVLAVLLSAAPATPLRAQELPTLTPEEYGRWETPGAAQLSPNGEWIAYGVTRVDESSELRLVRVGEDSTAVFPWGSTPRFSPDGQWVAWSVGLSPEERERKEEAGDPIRTGVALFDLRTGERQDFAAVSDHRFDASGRFLSLLGIPPREPEGKGADLRILTLESNATTTFGNVSELAWSSRGSRVALAIATGTDRGNGVQIYDPEAGTLRSADASGSRYRSLSWRKDASDLAALRSREAASVDGDAYEVLAWRGVEGRLELDVLENGSPGIGDTLLIVRHGSPAWSDDGTMISFGLRPFDPGESRDPSEGGRDGADEDAAADSLAEGSDEDEELPGLQIWHTRDVRVYPQQTAAASRDQERTLLAVWHLDEGRAVQLGSDLLANAQLLHGWTWALEDIGDPYPWGAMFGRPYHDVWRVDVRTGARSRLATRVRYEWPSAGGRWLVTYDGHDYASTDIATGEVHDLTASLSATFADVDYDTPTDQLPPFGFGPGGWMEEDATVLLYDAHDIWAVALDGSGGTRLTRGSERGLTHRVARLGDRDDEPGIDPDEPLYISLYDEHTEQRGYARLTGGQPPQQLILDDAFVTGLTRADSASVYLFRSMAFDDPPDYFVAGPDLANPTQVTDINPFMDDVAWGRAELFDYVSEAGRDLQAGLLYPANYREGERVPTIVYTYEMLTPQIHLFRVPNERDYYNFTVWTQQGYAVLLPDIVYRARDPGVSALESVRAAVAKAVELGVTDPDAVGLIGHSWGGYQATYLPTRTDIFAASVAGAPLTDFVSFMGALHWNPGLPELSHWETGQARMEVPFWEDPEAHRRNSPVHEVNALETPLLMAFGNEDGVVDWDQGTEFYNFARRAGKQMVLLVYEGEDHGFRQEANQRDYHRRILEWFGHYLKGEPPPSWITDGVLLDDLEAEKRRVARKVKPVS